MARRRKPPRGAIKEPRAIEASYIATLRRVWSITQGIIAQGLSPLFDIWPNATGGQGIIDAHLDVIIPPPIIPNTGVPASRRYNPLAPRPSLPRIWNLSDAQLSTLWPGVNPTELRLYAPWAVSQSEVMRIAYPGGMSAGTDLEEYVRRAITAERARTPRLSEPKPRIPSDLRRPPGAFRLRPRSYGRVILGANGLPIPSPPLPRILSSQVITRQIEWMDLATHRLLTVENLEDVVLPTGQKVSRNVRNELERVLTIDLRATDAGVAKHINGWRDRNVGLIEGGLRATDASPTLRPSLLGDVSQVIESAHAEGLRVEVLAYDLRERFGVSNSKAELIARDQVLKLNGQINCQRQNGAGIHRYTWSTSGDGRVRDSHADLDGTPQSWATPPEVAPGRYEHPGGDYQCRCIAIPIVPGD